MQNAKCKFKSLMLALTALAMLTMAASSYAQSWGVVMNGPLGGIKVPGAGPINGVDTSAAQEYVCYAGSCVAQTTVLNVQQAQTALTTVTTAQTMFTYSGMGAGFMNVPNRTLLVCGEAMFSNGATTPAITVSVKIGSSVTPVSVTTANNANTNVNSPLDFCFTISTAAIGTSGTDEAHGWVRDAVSAAWSSGTALATFMDGNTAVSSTYDHTVANTLTVNIASTATLTSVTPRFLIITSLI